MLWVQVPIPTARIVIDMRLICRQDFFSLFSLKSKVNVLIAIVLRSHYSQFLLFSWWPMISPNFLNHCVIHQNFVEHVDDQKTFQGILISSRVFRSIPTLRLGFLELEVIRDWWRTKVRHYCSVSQHRRRIDSLFVIPDHAGVGKSSNLRCYSVFSSCQQRLFNSSISRQLLA